MHVYIKLANFTAKPRFENLVACSRLSDSRVRRSVGSELNCTVHRENGSSLQSFFFPREFFSRVLLSKRLEQAKNPAIGQALSDLRAPSSTPSNFHSLICLMSLSGVQKNYSGVTNRPLQAKKVVSKGGKEAKFTTNKKTRDWCFHWSRGCCNQLVLRLTMTWLIFVTDGAKDHVAIFLTT